MFKKTIFLFFIFIVVSCSTNNRQEAFRADQHTVRPGETVYFIAWKNRQDPQKIIQWNNLDQTAKIYPGQKLFISRPPNYTNTTPAVKSASQTIQQNQRTETDTIYVNNKLYLPASDNKQTSGESQTTKQPSKIQQTNNNKNIAVIAMPTKRVKIPKKSVTFQKKWMWPYRGVIVKKFNFSKVDARGIGIKGKTGANIVAANTGVVVYSGDGIKNYGNLIIIKHNETYLSAYAHNKIIRVKEGQAVNQGQVISTMGDKNSYKGYLHFEIRKQGVPVNPLKHLP
jgi:lipoprotein NlpD